MTLLFKPADRFIWTCGIQLGALPCQIYWERTLTLARHVVDEERGENERSAGKCVVKPRRHSNYSLENQHMMYRHRVVDQTLQEIGEEKNFYFEMHLVPQQRTSYGYSGQLSVLPTQYIHCCHLERIVWGRKSECSRNPGYIRQIFEIYSTQKARQGNFGWGRNVFRRFYGPGK